MHDEKTKRFRHMPVDPETYSRKAIVSGIVNQDTSVTQLTASSLGPPTFDSNIITLNSRLSVFIAAFR